MKQELAIDTYLRWDDNDKAVHFVYNFIPDVNICTVCGRYYHPLADCCRCRLSECFYKVSL